MTDRILTPEEVGAWRQTALELGMDEMLSVLRSHEALRGECERLREYHRRVEAAWKRHEWQESEANELEQTLYLLSSSLGIKVANSIGKEIQP